MSTLLKRLLPCVIAILVVAAPIAESVAATDAPVAGAAKKKGKKCKKKGKKGKKSRCKKQGTSASPGFPGKPVDPNPPVEAPAILVQSLQLTENPLLAGTSGSGQVTISSPAPTGGQPVSLSSDDPSRATLPDSVHVAAGQTTASFPVTTTAGPNASVTLVAAIDASVRTTQLNLVEEAGLSRVALDYQCFPSVGASNFGANEVVFDVRTPTNAVVDLQSSDPFSLAVPSTVTVPAGSSTGVFGVDTLQTTPSVTVTASFDGIDRTDTASVLDASSPAPVASSLSLSANSVVVGDGTTGTVNLDCEAPAGGITVSLATSYPGVTVPASVTVPSGELSASFPITTVVSAAVGSAQITATAGAAVQATLTLRALGT